uniref:BTB domain-containing protein n=1 Tax=Panagrellus redivivus TaxID=6233 RepID=A0A7E4UP93_PANRE
MTFSNYQRQVARVHTAAHNVVSHRKHLQRFSQFFICSTAHVSCILPPSSTYFNVFCRLSTSVSIHQAFVWTSTMSYKRKFTDNVVMQVSNVPSAPEVARSKSRPVQGYPGCFWYLEMHTKHESYMAVAVIHVSKTPISGSFRLVCKSDVKTPIVDFTKTKEFRVDMSIGAYSTTVSVTCEATYSFESPLVVEGWFMRPYELMDDSSRWNSEFVVGDERVKVHRGFLMSISPVFEAMFSASTKETETGKVEITDMDATTVKNAIDFCLGHDVQEKTLEEFLGMHQFVDKYAIYPH